MLAFKKVVLDKNLPGGARTKAGSLTLWLHTGLHGSRSPKENIVILLFTCSEYLYFYLVQTASYHKCDKVSSIYCLLKNEAICQCDKKIFFNGRGI